MHITAKDFNSKPDNANVFKIILMWQADAQPQQMDADEDFNVAFRNCMRLADALASYRG